MPIHKVYLGLGTNLGEKEANLRTAINEIEKRIGKIYSLSAFYTTEPWGFVSENTFNNAVCCIETSLSPDELLKETQSIEQEMGRSKKTTNHIYSDRLIDIDILLYDNIIYNTPELTIPHPLICERDFVLKPLIEIAPEIIHPITGKKIKDYIK